jgi:adenosylmethionine-8-amino-7-oxononanoate aminotransferase
MKYNPERAPDSEDWLALDEGERIRLAEVYHRRARIEMPNVQAHAIFHAIVENQLAEGYEDVHDALNRLMTEGLDRHDAVHAIASVLAEHLNDMVAAGGVAEPEKRYFEALRKLTARKWLESYE